MKLSLSRRLQHCCRYIRKGDRVADIGCDHGYLGIHLLTEGIADFIIAADINQGPLHSAAVNARRYGVSDRMAFYLSDGLRSVPRDFNCLVCAGMGAETIISILKAAPWLCTDSYRLVLQCQTKTHLLREYLYTAGWQITEESFVRDGRFLYTAMSVSWAPGHRLTPGQCYIPPALAAHAGQELEEYRQRICQGLRQAVNGRGAENVPVMARALEELLAED